MSDDHPTQHIIMTINGHIDHLDHDQGHYHHMYNVIYDNHPDQIMMTIVTRMREMFKPSMAELGLCMYQVSRGLFKIVTIFITIVGVKIIPIVSITIIILSQLSTGGIML